MFSSIDWNQICVAIAWPLFLHYLRIDSWVLLRTDMTIVPKLSNKITSLQHHPAPQKKSNEWQICYWFKLDLICRWILNIKDTHNYQLEIALFPIIVAKLHCIISASLKWHRPNAKSITTICIYYSKANDAIYLFKQGHYKHNTVIKYIDTHAGAPKNASNQMQNTNSLQNCTSNCTLARGRTSDHKILSPWCVQWHLNYNTLIYMKPVVQWDKNNRTQTSQTKNRYIN